LDVRVYFRAYCEDVDIKYDSCDVNSVFITLNKIYDRPHRVPGYPGTRATRFSAYPAYPGYPAYPVFIDTQDIHIRKHDAKYVYKLKNTIEKIIY